MSRWSQGAASAPSTVHSGALSLHRSNVNLYDTKVEQATFHLGNYSVDSTVSCTEITMTKPLLSSNPTDGQSPSITRASGDSGIGRPVLNNAYDGCDVSASQDDAVPSILDTTMEDGTLDLWQHGDLPPVDDEMINMLRDVAESLPRVNDPTPASPDRIRVAEGLHQGWPGFWFWSDGEDPHHISTLVIQRNPDTRQTIAETVPGMRKFAAGNALPSQGKGGL